MRLCRPSHVLLAHSACHLWLEAIALARRMPHSCSRLVVPVGFEQPQAPVMHLRRAAAAAASLPTAQLTALLPGRASSCSQRCQSRWRPCTWCSRPLGRCARSPPSRRRALACRPWCSMLTSTSLSRSAAHRSAAASHVAWPKRTANLSQQGLCCASAEQHLCRASIPTWLTSRLMHVNNESASLWADASQLPCPCLTVWAPGWLLRCRLACYCHCRRAACKTVLEPDNGCSASSAQQEAERPSSAPCTVAQPARQHQQQRASSGIVALSAQAAR